MCVCASVCVCVFPSSRSVIFIFHLAIADGPMVRYGMLPKLVQPLCTCRITDLIQVHETTYQLFFQPVSAALTSGTATNERFCLGMAQIFSTR